MAASSQVVVGTAPTLLVSAPAAGGPTLGPVGWFALTNGTTALTYLGGTNVSTSNGYPLGTAPTGQNPSTLTGFLFPNDSLYGVVASSTITVDVLQMGL